MKDIVHQPEDHRSKSKNNWTLSFANPFAAYVKLKADDKAHVNTVLMAGFLCIGALLLGNNHFLGDAHFWEVLEGVLMAVIVGASFSTFDRIGFISPIQQRLIQLVDRHENLVATLDNITAQAPYYGLYREARSGFGFRGVMGIIDQPVNDDEPATVRRGTDESALEVIRSAPAHSTILYMNTYMENENVYYYEIDQAVMRGVNIKLLLLKPSPDAPAFRARYDDCLRAIFAGRPIDTVAHMVRGMVHRIDGLPREIEKRKSRGETTGSFEIRYYSDSLNFPMLILNDVSDGIQRDKRAYTGFYGRISSEAMPYIEWGEGKFAMIDQFIEIFERKWENNVDCTSLFPDDSWNEE